MPHKFVFIYQQILTNKSISNNKSDDLFFYGHSMSTTAPTPPTGIDYDQLEAAYVETLTPAERVEYQQHQNRGRADSVARRFQELAQERRAAMAEEVPATGSEGVLHNSLYRALSQARDHSMLGSPMLLNSELSRPGFTATLALASFYHSARAVAEMEQRCHGATDRYAEMLKLVNLLAPLVAAFDPDQEREDYQREQTRRYREAHEPEAQ